MPGQTSALSQQSYQKQEEKYKGLLRENADMAEKSASSRTRKNGWKNSTKAEKISMGVALAGIASVLGSEAFAVSAMASGALSSAAIAAYSGAMLVAGSVGMVIGAAGLYGSLIMKRLSKRKDNSKAPGA